MKKKRSFEGKSILLLLVTITTIVCFESCSSNPFPFIIDGVGYTKPSVFKYTIEENDGKRTVTITGKKTRADAIKIPPVIEGLPVTAIGKGAFAPTGSGKGDLSVVHIPKSVISIGEEAFFDNRIFYITISEGVISIGAGAFDRNQFESVTIPNSVTSIGAGAFNSWKLVEIKMPEGVTVTRGGSSRWGWLTRYYLANGQKAGTYSLKEIGENVYCSFNKQTIPESVLIAYEDPALQKRIEQRRAEFNAIMQTDAILYNSYGSYPEQVINNKIRFEETFSGIRIIKIDGEFSSAMYFEINRLLQGAFADDYWFRLTPGPHTFELQYRDVNYNPLEIITTTAAGTIMQSFEPGLYRFKVIPVGNKVRFELEKTTITPRFHEGSFLNGVRQD